MAIGMAAASAALMRLPISAIVFVALKFGSNITGVMEDVILAAVVAFIAVQLLERALTTAATGESLTATPGTEEKAHMARQPQEARVARAPGDAP
jgi:hypothetical protein